MIIEISDLALQDLENIKDYIKKDSKYYANLFIERIFTSMYYLTDHPKIGRIVPEFNIDYVREIFFESYRIIYKIQKDMIYIVTVIHGSRDLTRHIKDSDVT
jgi:plasmid stabilization system protein ParE